MNNLSTYGEGRSHPDMIREALRKGEIYIPDDLGTSPKVEKAGSAYVRAKTSYGTLVASSKDDPAYPGLFIELRVKKVNDTYDKDAILLAMIEYTPEKEKLQAVVYGDGEVEDYSDLIEYKKLLKED